MSRSLFSLKWVQKGDSEQTNAFYMYDILAQMIVVHGIQCLSLCQGPSEKTKQKKIYIQFEYTCTSICYILSYSQLLTYPHFSWAGLFKEFTITMHILSPVTDHCPSPISGREEGHTLRKHAYSNILKILPLKNENF